jgi:DNA repair exonuclease SbcCD ATPase subunit
MPNLAPIFQTIGRVRLRVRIQNGLEWVATSAVVGLLFSLSFLALGRLAVLSDSAAGAGVLAGLLFAPLGLLVGLLQPVSPLAAAKRIDISHGLKDRFSSAVDFSSRKHETSADEEQTFQAQMEELSMKEALSFAGEVKASKAAPLSTPKDLAGALAMALALILVSMVKLPSAQNASQPKPVVNLSPVLVDSFDLEQQKEKAQQLLQEAQEDGDKKTAELAQKLLNLWAAVEKGELTQEAALRQLAALEKEFGDAAKQKEALEKAAAELAKAFEKNPETKDLAEALKNQDFDKAAREFDKLADKLDKMSPKDREKLQEALERAAKAAEEMAKENKRELDDQDEKSKRKKKRSESWITAPLLMSPLRPRQSSKSVTRSSTKRSLRSAAVSWRRMSAN